MTTTRDPDACPKCGALPGEDAIPCDASCYYVDQADIERDAAYHAVLDDLADELRDETAEFHVEADPTTPDQPHYVHLMAGGEWRRLLLTVLRAVGWDRHWLLLEWVDDETSRPTDLPIVGSRTQRDALRYLRKIAAGEAPEAFLVADIQAFGDEQVRRVFAALEQARRAVADGDGPEAA